MNSDLPVLSVAQMREADRYTIEKGTPSKELMQRAAQGVYDAYSGWKDQGMEPAVYCLYERFSEDGAYYFNRCLEKGVKILRCGQDEVDLGAYGVLIDCMLGTGFSGMPREPIAGAIRAINEARKNHGIYVIAVDINSGMNGDTGESELAVKSDLTVSIGYPKTGFFTEAAAGMILKLVNAEIGIELPQT